jgi:S1-C subfamily serine protease
VSLEKDGPASSAGIREGDIIVEFGGEPVGGADDLHRLLTGERIGQRLPVTLLRATEQMTVSVVPRDRQ